MSLLFDLGETAKQESAGSKLLLDHSERTLAGVSTSGILFLGVIVGFPL